MFLKHIGFLFSSVITAAATFTVNLAGSKSAIGLERKGMSSNISVCPIKGPKIHRYSCN